MSTSDSKWYLQSEQGVEGPYQLHELQAMAAVSALHGDSQLGLSEEGPWGGAGQVSELELNWRLFDTEGQRLPACHILSLRAGVEAESLNPFQEIEFVQTGERYQLVDALCSALLIQNRVLEQRLAAPLPEDSPEQRRLQQDFQRESQHWQNRYEEALRIHEQRHEEWKSESGELKEELHLAGERIRALERRREQLEELLSLGENPENDSGDLDLQDAYAQLRVQQEHMLESLNLRMGQLEQSEARVEGLEEQLRKEQDAHFQELRSERDAAKAVQDQLKRLEQAHAELTRSYRDLNDRLIRMKRDTVKKVEAAKASALESNNPRKISLT